MLRCTPLCFRLPKARSSLRSPWAHARLPPPARQWGVAGWRPSHNALPLRSCGGAGRSCSAGPCDLPPAPRIPWAWCARGLAAANWLLPGAARHPPHCTLTLLPPAAPQCACALHTPALCCVHLQASLPTVPLLPCPLPAGGQSAVYCLFAAAAPSPPPAVRLPPVCAVSVMDKHLHAAATQGAGKEWAPAGTWVYWVDERSGIKEEG